MKKRVFSTIFLGSEEGSLIVLKKALSLPYLKIAAVITQPPRPVGRKQILTPTVVGQFAKDSHLTLITPNKIEEKTRKTVKELRPDLAILAAYGKILPRDFIDIFPRGVINIHPSLLPQFRGPTPISEAILKGNKTTGVSLFLIDNKIDHGPIIAQKNLIIKPFDNQQSLTQRLFLLGAQLLEEKLSKHLEGKIIPQPQNHRKATFTRLLSRQDGQTKSSCLKKAILGKSPWPKKIDRAIRAFYPWPGTYLIVNGQRVKILKTHLKNNQLKVDLIQFAGQKPTDKTRKLMTFLFPDEK
jgi:methionyl-tRNA formyltransferase